MGSFIAILHVVKFSQQGKEGINTNECVHVAATNPTQNKLQSQMIIGPIRRRGYHPTMQLKATST